MMSGAFLLSISMLYFPLKTFVYHKRGERAVLCLAAGKAYGGFHGDRNGHIPTAILSLGICAIFLFFPLHPLLTLAALFLFNMSMPLTLFASARILKGAKGTAFGLLTAALFMGPDTFQTLVYSKSFPSKSNMQLELKTIVQNSLIISNAHFSVIRAEELGYIQQFFFCL